MDDIEIIVNKIIEILTYYSNLKYAFGDVNRQLIIDKDFGNFLIMLEGWDNRERVHGCLVHL